MLGDVRLPLCRPSSIPSITLGLMLLGRRRAQYSEACIEQHLWCQDTLLQVLLDMGVIRHLHFQINVTSMIDFSLPGRPEYKDRWLAWFTQGAYRALHRPSVLVLGIVRHVGGPLLHKAPFRSSPRLTCRQAALLTR